jgi:adenylate cyclase
MMERRLAAILAADIAGYSRLMGADEERTHAQIKDLRKTLIDPLISEYRGHLVKTTGDGALVEFASALDAVRCSIAIQRAVKQRNVDIPEEHRIIFRMGINIGDIMFDEGDIYGDGVNVAVRLESAAKPGAICLSDNVYQQTKGKVALDVVALGEQQFKNIAQPIRVYAVYVDGEPQSIHPSPTLLPSKPSIAVLPFNNMSADPEQDYFADGIVEDIITALSKFRWLFVIARNSSFVYKGRAIDVKQVGRELGVRYVLEGSVRRAGNRLRVSVQLVDTISGVHHWAERYDRDLTDIFVLQDEITRSVAAAIEPQMLLAEGVRSLSHSPDDLDAWELVAKAFAHFWRVTREDNEIAIAMLTDSVTRYPNYAPSHSLLAVSYVLACHMGWLSHEKALSTGWRHAQRALELDENDAWVHIALGYLELIGRRTERALSAFRRAAELNPNSAMGHAFLGRALAFAGYDQEAIAHCEEAARLSPNDPQAALFLGPIGIAHYLAGRFNQAIDSLTQSGSLRPGEFGIQRLLCASLAQAGRLEEARALLKTIKERQPYISIEWIKKNVPYQTPDLMERFLDGIRKAGLE